MNTTIEALKEINRRFKRGDDAAAARIFRKKYGVEITNDAFFRFRTGKNKSRFHADKFIECYKLAQAQNQNQ